MTTQAYPWIDKVIEADAKAEVQHEKLSWIVDEVDRGEEIAVVAQALRAIAAELRASRIAQRPPRVGRSEDDAVRDEAP